MPLIFTERYTLFSSICLHILFYSGQIILVFFTPLKLQLFYMPPGLKIKNFMFQLHNIFVFLIRITTKGDTALTDHTVCVYSMGIVKFDSS